MEKVAVLLNANARSVTPAMVKAAESQVGVDNVFYSRSLDEAQAMARAIVERRYTRVVCGGGDGTLVTAVNMITDATHVANKRRLLRATATGRPKRTLPPPSFGLMCLGTGNALRHVVGAGQPVRDLQRLTKPEPLKTRTVPLIRARCTNGKDYERFLFAGIGHDAMALHDYNDMRAGMEPRVLRPMASNMGGYFLAMVSRTVPRWLNSEKPLKARIIARSSATYLDPSRQDQPVVFAPGTELYNGRVDFVGVSTVPYLGYGMRMFPFAENLQGHMQLRVARLTPWRLGRNLMPIWQGTYRNKAHVRDYIVSDVEVLLNKPFRYQHSGEDRGERQRLHFKVSHRSLQLALPKGHTKR